MSFEEFGLRHMYHSYLHDINIDHFNFFFLNSDLILIKGAHNNTFCEDMSSGRTLTEIERVLATKIILTISSFYTVNFTIMKIKSVHIYSKREKLYGNMHTKVSGVKNETKNSLSESDTNICCGENVK